jgi:hypothetical protein
VTDRRAETTTFLGDALASAVELGIATTEDVLRFATPDVLATALPRPLWARLLTACLGAAKVDAALIVETVGIPNLCEHLPAPILWACLSTAAARALDNAALAAVATVAAATTVVAPPPSAPSAAPVAAAAVGSSRVPSTAAGSGEWKRENTPAPLSITPPPAPRDAAPEVRTGSKPSLTPPSTPIPTPSPLIPDIDIEDDDDPIAPPPVAAPASQRRGSTRQPFRSPPPASAARPTAHVTARRPQAQAAPAPTTPPRRGQTEANDYDIATDIRSADDYRTPGGDELIEWSGGEETMTGDDDFGRKR